MHFAGRARRCKERRDKKAAEHIEGAFKVSGRHFKFVRGQVQARAGVAAASVLR